MYLVPEKGMLASRFISCLIAISMLFLILSSLALLQFSNSSFVSQSFFKEVIVNKTSVNWKLYDKEDKFESTLVSESLPQEKFRNQKVVSEGFSAIEDLAVVGDGNTVCGPNQARVKAYMYDLPPEFHFGLLGWRGNGSEKWPDVSDPTKLPRHPGGLNLQHSVEYWLTLDLLSSNVPGISRPCTAIRVHNLSEANVVFVPFFSSLSYNRFSKLRGKEKVSVNTMLQERLVKFLKDQDEWKRLDGKNHIIMAHHPNSMLNARTKLGSAMFVLADFGRYPAEIANLDKDVIAPYKHMVKTIPAENSPSFKERPTLIYFQGAIYRKDSGAIRQELYYLLKDEKDVHFSFGTIRSHGVSQAGRGMATSKFCLNIAGDTPSSNRLFDAIASHCVPVIISDEIELPFEDVLDYSEFSIFVHSSDAIKEGYLLNLLRSVNQNKWEKMWKTLKTLTKHFEYQYPSQPNDAVDMIWQAVAHKISSTLQLNVHRRTRYNRSQLFISGNLDL
ncbi:glycosyltransferase [Lithospermum erythrorhizon]|uniref:Glycosyltransferase n=1 Tax=Lithospermum erythrorhizon TaxID=34254 RepID=A0AAV3QVP1_LITER